MRKLIKGRTYNQDGSDGLVEPSVLLKQVTNDDTNTEQRHKERDGGDTGVLF